MTNEDIQSDSRKIENLRRNGYEQCPVCGQYDEPEAFVVLSAAPLKVRHLNCLEDRRRLDI